MIAQVESTQVTADEMWEEVKDVVVDTAKAFARKFHQYEDDMVADASTAFMKGYKAIIEGRANSTNVRTEIRMWVWYELFDDLRVRTRSRHKNRPGIEGGEAVDRVPGGVDNRRLVDLADSLSFDATVCARLTLNPPEEIVDIANAKGGTDCNYRSTIRQHLRRNGWAPERISEAFGEIATAITN